MSHFDDIQQKVREEYAGYASSVCDNVAAVTGKGIIHAVEGREDKMNGDVRIRYNNCKNDLEKNFWEES